MSDHTGGIGARGVKKATEMGLFMLRRIFVPLIVALFGLVAFGGIASAEPDAAEPDAAYAFVNPDIIAPDAVGLDDPFTATMVNFLPGETIDVVGTYIDGPFGLRRASVMAAEGDLSYTVVADSNGAVSIDVAGQKQGTILFVATGRTSGKSASTTVQIGPSTGNGTVTTTTVVAADGSTRTVVAAAPGASGGDGGGLAYTGASVAGPIAIGAAALLAGLAMLFFGTRGVIRRRNPGTRVPTS